MFKTILKVILTAITTGLFFLIVLGAIFGDVDDNGWKFLLVGMAAGVIIGIIIKDKYIGRKLGIIIMVFYLFLAFLMIVYAVYGLIFGEGLITGISYDGLAAIMLIAILIASLGLISLAFTVRLFIRKKES